MAEASETMSLEIPKQMPTPVRRPTNEELRELVSWALQTRPAQVASSVTAAAGPVAGFEAHKIS